MQLTKFADFSLRVLIFLAHRQGEHTTIREISQAHRISEDHLRKVVHKLSRRGYLKTARGKGGGIELARAPSSIGVGNVVRDVQPLAPVECFVPGYDSRCGLYPSCGLRGALKCAQSDFLAALDAYTIGDVMGARGPAARPPRRALEH